MLMIDSKAEEFLSLKLEQLRPTAKSSRCMYLKLGQLPGKTKEFCEHVLPRLTPVLPQEKTQIYVCRDGDIFILAPEMLLKEERALMDLIRALLQLEGGDDLQLFELDISLNAILVMLEQKQARIQYAQQAAEQQKLRLATEQKRKAILDITSIPFTQKTCIARRAERNEPRIMIIEDDVFSLRLVENVLNKQFEVVGLSEVDNALATYARLAPDLLFLDINLPDVSGHELLEKILQLDAQAYVVMLSGNCDQANIIKAMKAGAKGFVGKPFTRDKLFQYIERCPTISQTANA